MREPHRLLPTVLAAQEMTQRPKENPQVMESDKLPVACPPEVPHDQRSRSGRNVPHLPRAAPWEKPSSSLSSHPSSHAPLPCPLPMPVHARHWQSVQPQPLPCPCSQRQGGRANGHSRFPPLALIGAASTSSHRACVDTHTLPPGCLPVTSPT